MSDQILFSGVDGETGGWFQPSMDEETFASKILAQLEPDPRGLPYGAQSSSLAEMGWGIILPTERAEALRQQLQPLLDLREQEATQDSPDRFQVFELEPGYTKDDFWGETGAPSPGMPFDADRMPYYLLIAASPQEISFEFQYQLASEYAVGRIHFDHLEDYGAYARSIVAWNDKQHETTETPSLAIFGVEHEGDWITQQARKHLVQPLVEKLSEQCDWQVHPYLGKASTKPQLSQLLGGGQKPELLLTVAHGLAYRATYSWQQLRQGALVCCEWPGPDAEGGLSRDAWFGAEDLTDEADLHGLISFQMGCFTAGTPRLDILRSREEAEAHPMSERDFVAALAKRMLARTNGAQAIIGHVDRAWSYSFLRQDGDGQSDAYANCLRALMAGERVGYAISFLTTRGAALAQKLLLERISGDASRRSLLRMWANFQDARNFIILGDPACRIGGGRCSA